MNYERLLGTNKTRRLDFILISQIWFLFQTHDEFLVEFLGNVA
jgi:hypothetical protein